MQETEQIIGLYHTGFVVCLCMVVVFTALSIFLFLKFNIMYIFNLRTGREEKRTIKHMEEENAKTGKLRQIENVLNTTADLYQTPSGSIPPITYPITEAMDTGTAETVLLRAESPETNQAEMQRNDGKFVILKEHIVIHTKETI